MAARGVRYTNLRHPHLTYEGNSPVDIAEYSEGYYLTDDLTDRACRMIREVKATDPDTEEARLAELREIGMGLE